MILYKLDLQKKVNCISSSNLDDMRDVYLSLYENTIYYDTREHYIAINKMNYDVRIHDPPLDFYLFPLLPEEWDNMNCIKL
jgi:hypothetical protein